MSPNAVRLAVPLEELKDLEMTVEAMETEVLPRCILLYVPDAASKQKSPFSLAATNRYTAEIAIQNPDNTLLTNI